MSFKERIIFIVCYFIVLTAFCLVFIYSLNEEALLLELQEIEILNNLNLKGKL